MRSRKRHRVPRALKREIGASEPCAHHRHHHNSWLHPRRRCPWPTRQRGGLPGRVRQRASSTKLSTRGTTAGTAAERERLPEQQALAVVSLLQARARVRLRGTEAPKIEPRLNARPLQEELEVGALHARHSGAGHRHHALCSGATAATKPGVFGPPDVAIFSSAMSQRAYVRMAADAG